MIMQMRLPTLAIVLLVAVGATLQSVGAQGGHTSEEVWIESFDGLMLDATVFKPADASATDPVPLIIHSHGWGGSKATDGFDAWLDAGFGVLSFSQRGHGETGGTSRVMDPDFEGQDVIAVVDHVAGLDWVLKEDPEAGGSDGPPGLAHAASARGAPVPAATKVPAPSGPDASASGAPDPVIGAIGGSYGGGYQWVGAFTEVEETGTTRFDALSPEISWYDLPDSLAPNDVMRTAWVTGLYGTGAGSLPQEVHEAYWYAMATGQLPDGSVPGTHDIVSDLRENGPVGFVEDLGLELDVPVLMRQGMTDTLFNLNQAHRNYWNSLTDDARDDSYLVGYNGGHQQLYPAFQFPQGAGGSGDPCGDQSGGWEAFQIAFYENHLLGYQNGLPDDPFHLATTTDGCLSTDHMAYDGTPDAVIDAVATTTGAGAPQYFPVSEGPMALAGVPYLEATVTSAPLDARVFFGLAVGTSPADATVLGKAFMPMRVQDATLGATVEVELAGVAATLAEGEQLYLVVSPVVDQFGAHGSRVAGGVVLEDLRVDLPMPQDTQAS